MPAHAAAAEHFLHVVDHRRIAAQHRMRVFGRERQADARLEPAVVDRVRDAARERIAVAVAAHHRHVVERARVRARDARDLVAIRELMRMAHRVDEHDAAELRPRVGRAQHRQERADSGAGRQAPQRFRVGRLADAEETVGARREPDAVAVVERGEARRQRTLGEDDEVELVRLRRRRVHERIRTPDHCLLRIRRPGQREPRELPGDERHLRREDLQRMEAVAPASPPGNAAFHPRGHRDSDC